MRAFHRCAFQKAWGKKPRIITFPLNSKLIIHSECRNSYFYPSISLSLCCSVCLNCRNCQFRSLAIQAHSLYDYLLRWQPNVSISNGMAVALDLLFNINYTVVTHWWDIIEMESERENEKCHVIELYSISPGFWISSFTRSFNRTLKRLFQLGIDNWFRGGRVELVGEWPKIPTQCTVKFSIVFIAFALTFSCKRFANKIFCDGKWFALRSGSSMYLCSGMFIFALV